MKIVATWEWSGYIIIRQNRFLILLENKMEISIIIKANVSGSYNS